MCTSMTSKPTRRPRATIATYSAVTRSMSSRVMARGSASPARKGTALGARVSQALPSLSGRSPCQGSVHEPLRPAWPTCRPTRPLPLACIQSTMRFQAASWSSFQRPVQPCVMRPSADTQVISVMTRAAPPVAKLP